MTDVKDKSEKYPGIKTTAAKTDQGYATAITVWNTFAIEQGAPQCAELTEHDLSLENAQRLFAQFCSFLLERKDAKGFYSKPGTQVQY